MKYFNIRDILNDSDHLTNIRFEADYLNKKYKGSRLKTKGQKDLIVYDVGVNTFVNDTPTKNSIMLVYRKTISITSTINSAQKYIDVIVVIGNVDDNISLSYGVDEVFNDGYLVIDEIILDSKITYGTKNSNIVIGGINVMCSFVE